MSSSSSNEAFNLFVKYFKEKDPNYTPPEKTVTNTQNSSKSYIEMLNESDKKPYTSTTSPQSSFKEAMQSITLEPTSVSDNAKQWFDLDMPNGSTIKSFNSNKISSSKLINTSTNNSSNNSLVQANDISSTQEQVAYYDHPEYKYRMSVSSMSNINNPIVEKWVNKGYIKPDISQPSSFWEKEAYKLEVYEQATRLGMDPKTRDVMIHNIEFSEDPAKEYLTNINLIKKALTESIEQSEGLSYDKKTQIINKIVLSTDPITTYNTEITEAKREFYLKQLEDAKVVERYNAIQNDLKKGDIGTVLKKDPTILLEYETYLKLKSGEDPDKVMKYYEQRYEKTIKSLQNADMPSNPLEKVSKGFIEHFTIAGIVAEQLKVPYIDTSGSTPIDIGKEGVTVNQKFIRNIQDPYYSIGAAGGFVADWITGTALIHFTTQGILKTGSSLSKFFGKGKPKPPSDISNIKISSNNINVKPKIDVSPDILKPTISDQVKYNIKQVQRSFRIKTQRPEVSKTSSISLEKGVQPSIKDVIQYNIQNIKRNTIQKVHTISQMPQKTRQSINNAKNTLIQETKLNPVTNPYMLTRSLKLEMKQLSRDVTSTINTTKQRIRSKTTTTKQDIIKNLKMNSFTNPYLFSRAIKLSFKHSQQNALLNKNVQTVKKPVSRVSNVSNKFFKNIFPKNNRSNTLQTNKGLMQELLPQQTKKSSQQKGRKQLSDKNQFHSIIGTSQVLVLLPKQEPKPKQKLKSKQDISLKISPIQIIKTRRKSQESLKSLVNQTDMIKSKPVIKKAKIQEFRVSPSLPAVTDLTKPTYKTSDSRILKSALKIPDSSPFKSQPKFKPPPIISSDSSGNDGSTRRRRKKKTRKLGRRGAEFLF